MRNLTTKEIQAGITGAYIIMLIGVLSTEDKHKGSIIRIRNKMIPTLKKLPLELSKLADKAYELTKERHSGDTIGLDVGILIEALAFNKEDAMKELFGNDIITLISRGSSKVQLNNITKKQGRDSYLIADEMKKDLEKVVFYYKQKDLSNEGLKND